MLSCSSTHTYCTHTDTVRSVYDAPTFKAAFQLHTHRARDQMHSRKRNRIRKRLMEGKKARGLCDNLCALPLKEGKYITRLHSKFKDVKFFGPLSCSFSLQKLSGSLILKNQNRYSHSWRLSHHYLNHAPNWQSRAKKINTHKQTKQS